MMKKLFTYRINFLKQISLTLLATVLALGLQPGLLAQVPAFPGAEGFGAMTTGGRGGSVIEVTNLNDFGQGSLRAAIQASGARTVVFRVSGTIALQSELRITNGNLTIAGQTAPGDGICISNYPVTIDADNVIVRFIRFRHGDLTDSEGDAMWGREQQNIIIDHCSMSWSVDEAASFYDNKNFTLQYCILSESLYASNHSKGNHGYGGIWGGQGVTFHHNLLAHHTSRNPRFNGSRYSGQPDLELVDHRNNVIYNWGFNSAYGGEAGNHNIVANYYKPGPATSYNVSRRIVQPSDNENGYGTYYVEGNVTEGSPVVTEDNWLGVSATQSVKDEIRLETPLEAPALTPHNAYEAFEHVLSKAGAILPKRDAIDTRIIREARTGTATFGGEYGDATGIIDSQETVGGWVTLESNTPPEDTDHDGMPDAWEDQMGLDKNNPDDRNDDLNGNGYTNLEDYLNGLVDAYSYILRPIRFQVDTIIDYAVTLSWQDISDNETGFVIERKEGENWTELVTAAAGDTVYTDNTLSENGSYLYRIKAVNASMESFYSDSVVAQLTVGVEQMRSEWMSLQLYPHPASHQATLRYAITQPFEVIISVVDLTGREMMVLEKERRTPGEYTLTFGAESLEGGVYMIVFRAGENLLTKKMLIAR